MGWHEADAAETVRGLTPAQRNVLRFIAARCREEMSMFWGQDRIAHHLDMSRRSVVTAMQVLEDRGMIRKAPRANSNDGVTTRSSNRTILVMDEVLAHALPEAVDKYRAEVAKAAAKSANPSSEKRNFGGLKSAPIAQSNREVNSKEEQASKSQPTSPELSTGFALPEDDPWKNPPTENPWAA